MQYNFPKMREGVKGRLEFFQKFIQFGSGILPYASLATQSILLQPIAIKRAYYVAHMFLYFRIIPILDCHPLRILNLFLSSLKEISPEKFTFDSSF